MACTGRVGYEVRIEVEVFLGEVEGRGEVFYCLLVLVLSMRWQRRSEEVRRGELTWHVADS